MSQLRCFSFQKNDPLVFLLPLLTLFNTNKAKHISFFFMQLLLGISYSPNVHNPDVVYSLNGTVVKYHWKHSKVEFTVKPIRSRYNVNQPMSPCVDSNLKEIQEGFPQANLARSST